MSLYRKLAVTLYRMPEFRRLPVTAKLVFIALLTSPGTTMIPGLYEGDALVLASVLAIDVVEAESALKSLNDAGLIEADLERSLIAVAFVDAIKDHAPANESVAKGWANTLANVIESPVRGRHAERLARLWPAWKSFLATPCGQGVDTVSAPSGTPCDLQEKQQQEQQQQEKQEQQEGEGAANAASPPPGSGSGSSAGSRKQKKTKAAKKDDAGPLPFRAAQAVETVAQASAGAFVASKLSPKKAIDVEELVKRYGTLEEWALVGAWLPNGSDAWKLKDGPFDVRALLKYADDWMAQAAAWDLAGRKPAGKNAGARPGFVKPCDAVPEGEGGEVKDF